MKLRETLLDGEKNITQPDGIEIAPNNVAYAFWGWFGLLFAIIGGVTFISGWSDL